MPKDAVNYDTEQDLELPGNPNFVGPEEPNEVNFESGKNVKDLQTNTPVAEQVIKSGGEDSRSNNPRNDEQNNDFVKSLGMNNNQLMVIGVVGLLFLMK